MINKPEPKIEVPKDKPVLYTDSIFISSNQYGVVINFAQFVPGTNEHVVVARVGMSEEHAQTLIDLLSDNLRRGKILKAKKVHA